MLPPSMSSCRRHLLGGVLVYTALLERVTRNSSRHGFGIRYGDSFLPSSYVTGKGAVLMNRPTEEEVRRRAYEIYVKRGSQPGHDDENWLEAERELTKVFNNGTLDATVWQETATRKNGNIKPRGKKRTEFAKGF